MCLMNRCLLAYRKATKLKVTTSNLMSKEHTFLFKYEHSGSKKWPEYLTAEFLLRFHDEAGDIGTLPPLIVESRSMFSESKWSQIEDSHQKAAKSWGSVGGNLQKIAQFVCFGKILDEYTPEFLKNKPYYTLLNGAQAPTWQFRLNDPIVNGMISLACAQNDFEFLDKFVSTFRHVMSKRNQRLTREDCVGSFRDMILILNWLRLSFADCRTPGLCWFAAEDCLGFVNHFVREFLGEKLETSEGINVIYKRTNIVLFNIIFKRA